MTIKKKAVKEDLEEGSFLSTPNTKFYPERDSFLDNANKKIALSERLKNKVEKINNMPIKETENKKEYQKIFPDKKEVEYIKYDVNYFTIRKMINNFYLIKLDRFRNIKIENNGDSLWNKYCNWFNSAFNKPKEYKSDYLGDVKQEIFESDK